MTEDAPAEIGRLLRLIVNDHQNIAAILIVNPDLREDALLDAEQSPIRFNVLASVLLGIIDRLLIATPDQVDEIEDDLETRARFAFLSARLETEGETDDH